MALRIGAENKPKTYAAIGLGVIVLFLALRIVLPSSSSPAPAAAPAAPPPTPVATTPAPSTTPPGGSSFPHEAIKVATGDSALDPTLHPEVMEQAEQTTYNGNGRNIFSPNSVAPTPVHIEKPQAFRPSAPVVPAGPPPPPSIDLKFYGYSSIHGGRREIFLLHGDDIFLAHEGDVVDRRYRIVSIRPFAVEIEDIPYHNTQSVPLTQN